MKLLTYSDDLMIIGELQDKLKSLLYWSEKAELKVGLYTNEDKMEYMVVEKWDTMGLYPTLLSIIKISKERKQFKYQELILSEKHKIKIKITARI